MKRVLEPEAMDDLEEARAYNELVAETQGNTLDECFALSVLNMGIPEGKALDMGTGTGRIPLKIVGKNQNLDITAIDLSENMLTIAEENQKRFEFGNSVNFEIADACNLPYEDNTFDMVYSHVTFHHIPDPVKAFKEANRVLKPEGALLIRDLKRPRNRLVLEYFVAAFGKEYDKIQKKLYRDSLKAAFTKDEFLKMGYDANIKNFIAKNYFITHIGLERKGVGYKPSNVKYSEPKGNDFVTKTMRKHHITR